MFYEHKVFYRYKIVQLLFKGFEATKVMADALTDSKEFRRLEKNLNIELLWIYILAVLKKKDLHAYAMRKVIERKFGFGIGEVTSYVVLYKLEARGFVSSRKQKNRKIYRITGKGKRLIKEAADYMKKRHDKLFS